PTLDTHPAYVVDSYQYLISHDIGSAWKDLIRAWLLLEDAQGYLHGAPLPTLKKRPGAVADWVARGRPEQWKPLSPWTAVSGSRQFWGWWAALQPAWRGVSISQTPFRACHRTNAQGQAWGKLRTSGINGHLSVLAVLAWWGDACRGDESALGEWHEAVQDVDWV
ncbi:hypothetical protein BDZ89DRAFT_900473, partial [Hymenopellis radicata]